METAEEEPVPVLTRLWSSLRRPASAKFDIDDDFEMVEKDGDRISFFYARSGEVAGKDGKPATGLGMISGVFIPTLNSIFGVEVFLRWTWATGQAGILQALVALFFGSAVAIITALSVSAISTNEVVKSGGAYYMIARSLGAAFGGSIGFLFFIALAFSVGSNALGFAETVVERASIAWFVVDESSLLDLNVLSVAAITVVSVVFLSLLGNAMFSKLSTLILGVILFALMFVMFCAWFQPDSPALLDVGFVTPSLSTLRDNMFTGYDPNTDFVSVFSVVYPSMTAILTGANMSGALSNPGKSIPIGTIIAVLCMVGMYGMIIVTMGSCVTREYLKSDFYIMQNISKVPEIVFTGTLLATYSSALSALVSASQVFQSMTKDRLFGSKLAYFGVEHIGKTEALPRRAIVLSSLVGLLVLGFGDVNTIAPYLSNCMLMTFATLNFAAMILDLSHTPNYRPTFQGCNWKISAFGTLICLGTMFMMDWIKAFASCTFATALFALLHKFPPEANWGSPHQAVLYRVAMSYVMKLDFRKVPVKYWRPQVLALVKDPLASDGIAQFASACKMRGLLVLGHVLIGRAKERSEEKRQLLVDAIQMWRDQKKVGAFVEVCIASCLQSGTLALIQVSGLGCLKPNTVVMGLPNHADFSVPANCKGIDDWWASVQQTMELGLNCIIGIGLKGYDRNIAVPKPSTHRMPGQRFIKPTIDVWLSGVGDYEAMYELFAARTMVVLQLAYLFASQTFWKKRTSLRVILLLPGESEGDVQQMVEEFRAMMAKVRLTTPIKVLCTSEAAQVMIELNIKPRRKTLHPADSSDAAVAVSEGIASPTLQPVLESRDSFDYGGENEGDKVNLLSSSSDRLPEIPGFSVSKHGAAHGAGVGGEEGGENGGDNGVGGGGGGGGLWTRASDAGRTPAVWSDFDAVSLHDRNRVLNVLMHRHSGNAAQIFLQPAVSALSYNSGLQGARRFIRQQEALSEGLCPVAIVMPNDSEVDERVAGAKE